MIFNESKRKLTEAEIILQKIEKQKAEVEK